MTRRHGRSNSRVAADNELARTRRAAPDIDSCAIVTARRRDGDGLRFTTPVNVRLDNANMPPDARQREAVSPCREPVYPASKITVEGFADTAGIRRTTRAGAAPREPSVPACSIGFAGTLRAVATVSRGRSFQRREDDPGAKSNAALCSSSRVGQGGDRGAGAPSQ